VPRRTWLSIVTNSSFGFLTGMIDISFKQNAVSFSLNCTDLTFTEYEHRSSTTSTVMEQLF
jgi:hypothetical protein